MPPWVAEFPGSVTVSGKDGTILYMNDAAGRAFEKSGGKALVGSDLAACHGERSNAKIREIMEGRRPNAYTIEKAGKRKLIYQAPWYESGELAGVVELAVEIPDELPHFNRG
jgi:DUF438 domain-containing protein